MNSNVEIFNHKQFGDVRVKVVSNEVYFLGNDVTKALGYKNSRKALKDHCKRVTKLDAPHPQSKTKTLLMNFIPESDLYRLIVSSKLPTAKQFEKWVFEEVLPSIRKHGAYITDNTLDKIVNNPDLLIELATNLKEERELRIEKEQLLTTVKEENKKLEGTIETQAPKVNAWEAIVNSEGMISVGEFAKSVNIKGLGRNNMYQLLRNKKIIMPDSTQPYQSYVNKGYFAIKLGHNSNYLTNTQTFITMKGCEWLVNKLKEWKY